MQLLVCREIYRDGWKPNWKISNNKLSKFMKNLQQNQHLYYKIVEGAKLTNEEKEIIQKKRTIV